ncbi:hypothetical protein [Poseidonibacter ostreae]|uniref:Uncharacterized protein n=1 Tax=Poseidonibacter ostreae TaxID=2654171 RepID=A0A6L4WWF5_9BACT|nr:hypothetical protein [Poseidonibacter ostreae]KAB7891382.1 hypothetical protein GBG19_00670 [Poseidonibacter ostreae]
MKNNSRQLNKKGNFIPFTKDGLSVMLIGKNWYNDRNCELVLVVNSKDISNRIDYTTQKETEMIMDSMEKELGDTALVSSSEASAFISKAYYSIIA